MTAPLAGGSLSTRTYLRGGRSRRVRYSVRMFGFAELRDWLRRASPRWLVTARTGSR